MSRRFLLAYLGVASILAGALVVLRTADQQRPAALQSSLESIGTTIAGWTMTRSEQLGSRPLEVLRPTSYLVRTYAKNGFQLGVFIAYYASQRAGEAMHSPKNCLPGGGWMILKQGSISVPFRNGSVAINRFTIQNAGQRLTTLYWYQSATRIVANEYVGKMRLVQDAVLEGRTDGSLVRIIVPNTPEAEGEAIAFAATLMRQVDECIRGEFRSATKQARF